jgi:hypothetical protein
MAKHLTTQERDMLRRWQATGLQPTAIHAKLVKLRSRQKIKGKKMKAPDLTAVRKVLKGKTYLQGKPEARGRKRILTTANVLTMNRVRKELIVEADSEQEVAWKEVISKSRVPKVHRTTAAKAFQNANIPVARRPPRQKPQRDAKQKKQRHLVTGRWRRYHKKYFHKLDLIIDNKRWDAPTTARGRKYIRQQKTRWHLRTPQEGLKNGFTRPNPKRHRTNPGGVLHVCAGISHGRVVLWEYLDKRWCGESAAKLYSGPIKKVLHKKCGQKKKYRIMEDNDPAGYKSSKGQAAKEALGIVPIEYPKYSPDLMPQDFFLWRNIEDRMAKTAPTGNETVKAFKKRLRLTALRTSPTLIKRALDSIPKRAHAVWKAKGGDIARD